MPQFEEFGTTLRTYRVAANESLEEVSSAVEINVEQLKKIENGDEKPSEDILQLLVLHFSLHRKEAYRLFTMAGYSSEPEVHTPKERVDITSSETVAYTDMVHVVSNQFGVIMNFVQGFNGSGNPEVVARVGMSREHAKSVLEILQKTLEAADQSEQG